MIDADLSGRFAGALSYPAVGYAEEIGALRGTLARELPGVAVDVEAFETAVGSMSLGALQELYTSTFDLNPQTTLDASWHLFGERHERGPFLAGLREDLRAAGVRETAELPDHLTQLLRLAGRSDPDGNIAALIRVVLDRIVPVLEASHNPYVFLIRAVGRSIGAQINDARDDRVPATTVDQA